MRHLSPSTPPSHGAPGWPLFPQTTNEGAIMDDKKSLLTTLPPLLVAAGTLITAVIGLGNFMSSPAPSITEFDVSPSIIDTGGNATLKWTVSGDVSSISIDPGIGIVALSGSRQVSPANTTNYTLTAKNKGQAKTASAQLVVRAAIAAQGVNKENISASTQKPAAFSVPSQASNVGDEPVHSEAPKSKEAPKAADNINSISSTNNANKPSDANSAADTNITSTLEKTTKDKSAISVEPKSSGATSKSTGDEFMQMNDLQSTSKSKDAAKSIDTSSNSAAGDEPIQMTASRSPNAKNASKPLNSTNQTALIKTAAGTKSIPSTTKAASSVGDVA